MRFAVLLSGQPRNVAECSWYINNNIIWPNKADVFIHSWIDPKMVGKQYVSRWMKPEISANGGLSNVDDVASNPIPSDIDKIILKEYSPTRHLFEPPKIFTLNAELLESRLKTYMDPQDTCSFIYSMYAANKLKQEHEAECGFTYDVVLRMRLDTIFWQVLHLNQFYTQENIVFTSDTYPNPVGISDHWAISNSHMMDVYTSAILFIDDLLADKHLFWQNEIVLGQWVRIINGAQIRPCPIAYHIFRRS